MLHFSPPGLWYPLSVLSISQPSICRLVLLLIRPSIQTIITKTKLQALRLKVLKQFGTTCTIEKAGTSISSYVNPLLLSSNFERPNHALVDWACLFSTSLDRLSSILLRKVRWEQRTRAHYRHLARRRCAGECNFYDRRRDDSRGV
jgi:hypothetical protein